MIREILEQHLDDLIDLYEGWCRAREANEPEDPLIVQRIDAHLEGWILGGEQSAAILETVDDQPGPGRTFARYALELKGFEVIAEGIDEPDDQMKRNYSLVRDRARAVETQPVVIPR